MSDPEVLTVVGSRPEAELIHNLLADHGIPAMIRSQSSVLGSLQADGPQAVLVPAAALEDAREVLSPGPEV